MKIKYVIGEYSQYARGYELECWVELGGKMLSTGTIVYSRRASARRGIYRFANMVQFETQIPVELIELEFNDDPY